ncbi:MAG: valine--tRNA ligase [Hyphomicrobium sp.]|jgi:valyl-tRNA synthetase
MLEKTYQPADIEPRISEEWNRAEAFKAGREERKGAEPYCIVIPPPNVTGSLHMGHALNNTLQDVLCRFERMRGRDVLWQPGTDHAGIATQMVVERKLAADKKPDRRTLGREAFLREVWTWKEESGSTIVNQLRRLGASCDWSRERFTMDEGLSRAVIKVFVELNRKGLIYKDKRLVNWDPKFQTAISDLEVVQVEKKGSFTWVQPEAGKQVQPEAGKQVQPEAGKQSDGDPEKPFDAAALAKVLDRDPNGHMYHFRYPLKDDPTRFIVVATTRPETMLGDAGVAVHPEDERYTDLVGKMVLLPLVGREIPIVADEYSDPEKGTGAVKITPAHDFNDFEVGKRQGLDKINILDAFGRLNDEVPEAYRGLDRFEARKKVVADLEKLGLLAKIEPTTQQVPHGDRSGVAIEPWLTDQWYVNAGELAKPALEAVRSGKTKFVPERFANDYYRWLENIQPWCISRQLWWGHQIPAWYGPDGDVYVAHDEEEAAALAKKHHKKDVALTRDEDVLDTWFSSALWPFSTLGWPDETPEVARYYPTNALVTGFDIIFFWIARMMMMGLHFKEDVPFRDVYIHGLVRDAQGHKMSKTRGNVIDPLDIIDGIALDKLIAKRTAGLNKEQANRIEKEIRKEYPEGIKAYGTDALRFTMAAMAAQGSDLKLSIDRVEGYRNFATKLWNASRFAEMNECVRQRGFDPGSVTHTLNKWIVGETERAASAVTAGIEGYKFNEAAGSIYEFVWGVFCDWYLELIKPILASDDDADKAETRATVAWVLDQCLKLLHPFMPFITEELWAHMVEHGEARNTLLCLSEWPRPKGLINESADEEISWVVKLVSEVRSVRTEMNVPAGAKIPLVIAGQDVTTTRRARTHDETIKRLARLDNITFAKTAPKGAALIVIGEATVALPLEGIIDMEAERKRLTKDIDKAEQDRGKAAAWLANEANVAKSPEHVVELNRERVAEGAERIKRLRAALKRLEG